MDARLDPARLLGLEEGDAHVIRNAGGRAADALRSVIISQQLLGTREIVIIHHVRKFTHEAMMQCANTDFYRPIAACSPSPTVISSPRSERT